VAGPWFTVVEDNSNWRTADSILISNGQQHVRGEVQIKVELVKANGTNSQLTGTEVQLTESEN
jgi:hypothetical protein